MENSCDGIVLIDKEEGETSFSAVRKIRRLLGLKKAGHAGTLDPFATGLLIVLLGQGTKLSSYLMSGEKRYSATLGLGVETDTLDRTGRVMRTSPVPELHPDFVRERARRFVGEIEQVPPVFSALKVDGERAYRLARKGVKFSLEKRKVTIHSLEIRSVEASLVTLEVVCSKGTYIRSLAADLGRELGTLGHLKALRRLACGPFDVGDAASLVHSGDGPHPCLLRDRIIPLKEAVPFMEEIRVDDRMARRVRSGYQPQWVELSMEPEVSGSCRDHVRLVNDGNLVAIMKMGADTGEGDGRPKIMRVFH